MKKKISLILLIVVGLFMITGCSNSKSKNQSTDGKSYNVNGVSVKLDKDEERDGMKYKTSDSFEKDFKVNTTTYFIYKDKNGDKYDLSNLTFRLDVNIDDMNLQSKIDREKELVMNKDNFENVQQSQKTLNGITWDYFSFYNNYDNNRFQEHLYMTERKIDNYYYVYKIYFSYVEDIEDFEEAFMNSISFE